MTDNERDLKNALGQSVPLSDGLCAQRYELFEYFNKEHGLILLESQVDEIINNVIAFDNLPALKDGEVVKRIMGLPFDVARCKGVSDDDETGINFREGCEDCLRRTAPGRSNYQSWMQPPLVIAFECEYRIDPKAFDIEATHGRVATRQ